MGPIPEYIPVLSWLVAIVVHVMPPSVEYERFTVTGSPAVPGAAFQSMVWVELRSHDSPPRGERSDIEGPGGGSSVLNQKKYCAAIALPVSETSLAAVVTLQQ
jgi:hypothetical protein